MRANNSEINCKLEKNLAKDLAPVKVIPQDISRVLINLFNNAFYAIIEKSKTIPAGKYSPCIGLTTEQNNQYVIVRIRDNGTGIPETIREKIFTPFFTTKPTGQGTGLGLSLTYDIIKAHGGNITVDSKEGEGSEFIISLPK